MGHPTSITLIVKYILNHCTCMPLLLGRKNMRSRKLHSKSMVLEYVLRNIIKLKKTFLYPDFEKKYLDN